MTTTKNDRFQLTIWTLLLLAAIAMPGTLRGEEPPDCLKCSTAQRGVPLLSKIPYISRFFKIAAAEEAPAGLPQDFERIGIDFDFDICSDCPVPSGIASAACTQNAGAQLFAIRRATFQQVASPCCEAEPCCGKECAEASPCCRSACETAERRGPSWERIVELSATNAALQASLEAQTAFHKEKTEMFEMIAELSMEKVALEASIVSQAKHAELTKEMLELASENGRLKAQVEMAETKLTLVQEMVKVALENERLKLALQARLSRGQLVDDVEYLPPTPEASRNLTAPAKRASFQEIEPPVQRPKLER